MSFENSRLWKQAFDSLEESPDREYHERLKVEFVKFRRRAGQIASTIAASYPSLTDHSLIHIDALWDMASLILPESARLNPVECFVLGGAFLIHDLGNGIGAYPGGGDELRALAPDLWRDTVAALYREKHSRLPSANEIDYPPSQIYQIATEVCLRAHHAERAQELATTVRYVDPENGEKFFLIEDSDLRDVLGHQIGEIAASHWWPIGRVKRDLNNRSGAPAGFPPSWSYDLLQLACLIRTADAAHLDRRRAPPFLRAMRRPQGVSLDHWGFQGMLPAPRLENHLLSYTSSRRFEAEDFERWWLAYDAFLLLDRELRQAEALLAESNRKGFAARGVAGIENPIAMTNHLRVTRSWTPIEARLKVSNVASLVERLGGRELYGDDPSVPLRELIQNATDAVRARQVVDHHQEGRVTVRLSNASDESWIEVEDIGIGMSQKILAEALLDFGNSFWGSQLMREEYPGLWAAGFEPAGRYGIGFFSLFMWGKRVKVTSLRYDQGRAETHVLEIRAGLQSRPLLRAATRAEELRTGGTKIRVWLQEPLTDPRFPGAVIDSPRRLAELCIWLAPTLPVDLYVDGVDEPVIRASDWKELEPTALLQRLAISIDSTPVRTDPPIEEIAKNLRPIQTQDGQILGRACILPSSRLDRNYHAAGSERRGVIAVDGFRATNLEGVSGVVLGQPRRAARDHAEPLASTEDLGRWASDQARIIPKLFQNPLQQMWCASYIRTFNGETGPLPIALWQGQYCTFEDLAHKPEQDELGNKVLLLELQRLLAHAAAFEAVRLPKTFANVLVVDASTQTPANTKTQASSRRKGLSEKAQRVFLQHTAAGATIQALALRWDVDLEELYANSYFSQTAPLRLPVYNFHNRVIKENVYQILNPRS